MAKGVFKAQDSSDATIQDVLGNVPPPFTVSLMMWWFV